MSYSVWFQIRMRDKYHNTCYAVNDIHSMMKETGSQSDWGSTIILRTPDDLHHRDMTVERFLESEGDCRDTFYGEFDSSTYRIEVDIKLFNSINNPNNPARVFTQIKETISVPKPINSETQYYVLYITESYVEDSSGYRSYSFDTFVDGGDSEFYEDKWCNSVKITNSVSKEKLRENISRSNKVYKEATAPYIPPRSSSTSKESTSSRPYFYNSDYQSYLYQGLYKALKYEFTCQVKYPLDVNVSGYKAYIKIYCTSYTSKSYVQHKAYDALEDLAENLAKNCCNAADFIKYDYEITVIKTD